MVAVFIIFFFTIPLLVLISSTFRRKPYPPGPKGWPVIGNINMMNQLTHRGLAELAKRHGGVFHLRMGFRHMIFVSGPNPAREVLQVHDHIFSNRPANICTRYLTYDRSDLVFANYGPFWRKVRKLCVTKLFSRYRAESWAAIAGEVDTMVRRVAAGSSTAISIGDLLFEFSRSFIYRAAFGSGSVEGQEEFMKILPEFSKLFGTAAVGDFIPWLGFVNLNGLRKRLVEARASLDGFIDRIIDDHMMKREKAEENVVRETDMVDELLAFYSDGAQLCESEDLQSSIKLTRNNVKGIIMVSQNKKNVSYFYVFMDLSIVLYVFHKNCIYALYGITSLTAHSSAPPYC